MKVLNDILDFSKIEADQIKFESIDFPLQQVVLEVVRLFERSALNKGVALDSETLGLEGRVVRGDPTRLRQVLLNLVGNAIKFTEEGRIVIRTAALASENQGFDGPVRGPGHRYRDRGSRMRSPVPGVFPSGQHHHPAILVVVGLGLAICLWLVEGMGGTIGLISEPGAGSTFWFTVPLGCVATQHLHQPAG